MLILSKRKDYYDGVVGTMGIDKTLVYDRQVIEVEEKDYPDILKRKRYSWRKSNDTQFYNITRHDIKKEFGKKYQHYSYFLVGFCGKLYIGWKLYHEVKTNIGTTELITEITYDFEYLKTIIKEREYWGNMVDDVNYILNYDSLYLFRDLKAPIFVYDGDYNRTSLGKYWRNDNEKFFINPNLSDYEFYKVFDAFKAFQEISMFMGGVLGRGEKEIVVVEDKYKIAQHGFDKFSFRKDKETK